MTEKLTPELLKAVAEQKYTQAVAGLLVMLTLLAAIVGLLSLVGITGLWPGVLIVWAAFGGLAINNMRVAKKKARELLMANPKIDW